MTGNWKVVVPVPVEVSHTLSRVGRVLKNNIRNYGS